MDYSRKTYGRNEEVKAIFHLFSVGKDVSKHGPRRLGKTFVLDRMVEQGEAHGFICVKVEIAGCTEPRMVFQRLCEEINKKRKFQQRAVDFVVQRMQQLVNPRREQNGSWYTPFLNHDWETHFERLLAAMNDHKFQRWAILIDELPIFLKALHDKGDTGLQQARDFMNLFSSLRSKCPHVRWLVTGSIGIEPLARAGNYLGVMAKFTNYTLAPLIEEQAIAFIQDQARTGALPHRQEISTEEAKAIIHAVGWRAAYYLDNFASQLTGTPSTEASQVQHLIQQAQTQLLLDHHLTAFGTWEEHIRKHHGDKRKLSFDILNLLARDETGLDIDALFGQLGQIDLERNFLAQHLQLLINEGFLFQSETNSEIDEGGPYRFRIAILRLWWKKYPCTL